MKRHVFSYSCDEFSIRHDTLAWIFALVGRACIFKGLARAPYTNLTPSSAFMRRDYCTTSIPMDLPLLMPFPPTAPIAQPPLPVCGHGGDSGHSRNDRESVKATGLYLHPQSALYVSLPRSALDDPWLPVHCREEYSSASMLARPRAPYAWPASSYPGPQCLSSSSSCGAPSRLLRARDRCRGRSSRGCLRRGYVLSSSRVGGPSSLKSERSASPSSSPLRPSSCRCRRRLRRAAACSASSAILCTSCAFASLHCLLSFSTCRTPCTPILMAASGSSAAVRACALSLRRGSSLPHTFLLTGSASSAVPSPLGE